jgi:serine/threonine-protein kinase
MRPPARAALVAAALLGCRELAAEDAPRFRLRFELKAGARASKRVELKTAFPFPQEMVPAGESAVFLRTADPGTSFEVGVVLYEMFTGVRPFQGMTTIETLRRALTEIAPPVRRLRPELPEAVDTLIQRAMARNPEERFRSAAELRRALGIISA